MPRRPPPRIQLALALEPRVPPLALPIPVEAVPALADLLLAALGLDQRVVAAGGGDERQGQH
jgi:hypothetical protein